VDELFSRKPETDNSGPVECLGMTFPSDEERRKHFLEILREKLRDPEFRKIEGFPIGSDEDILALSDPPYYTACPNPFIADFIKHYGKPCDPSTPYSREPLAVDITEGKTERYYNVHTYHTKVPYRAIARFVLHYTLPGDIILDSFCGTGMTGLATQACSDSEFVRALSISPHELVGGRIAVLADLSPAATHIAANYNGHVNSEYFEHECQMLLREFIGRYGWMFTTTDPESGSDCLVDYYVWSDVFACPECGHEIVFWDEGVDQETGQKSSDAMLVCPNCKAENHRDRFDRVEEVYFDDLLMTTAKIQKEKLIRVVYRKNGKQMTKTPDASDNAILERVRKEPIADPVPILKMMRRDGVWGDMYRSGYHLGITHFHHFYYRRSLKAVAWFWRRIGSSPVALQPRLRWWLQSVGIGHTRLNRYFSSSYSQVNRYLKGFLYIAQVRSEVSPWYALTGKIRQMAQNAPGQRYSAISTSSATAIGLNDSSVDYIFTDPPFGGNIIYSELNFIWEAWLGVFTEQGPEAIVSAVQQKDLTEYQQLMQLSFKEYFRVLKPGRWMTILFHNSKNAVWIAIQTALEEAGFVVADVRVFDKKQLTMKQQTTTGTVQKDLLISVYKPNGGLEDRFKLEAATEDGVWDFVRTHLKQLPIFVFKDGRAEVVAERQGYLLFDRMVAFHVQRSAMVPLSASEFYSGMEQRFPIRDGMYFLPDQAAEYDKKRLTVREVLQLEIAITGEDTAIEWLRQQLSRKPQTFQELHPQFLKEIAGWQKFEKPLELSELLEQNFLRYDGSGEVPSQIHSYLSTNFKELRSLAKDDESLRSKGKDRWYVPDPNKAGDLEKLRERALLREFWEYLPPGYKPANRLNEESYLPGLTPKAPILKGKRFKVIRLEAVRAGFKHCWQNRDYRTIIAVAERIPENVLQEDAKLLMWYDQAVTRMGDTR
jgi:DNA modification methylase